MKRIKDFARRCGFQNDRPKTTKPQALMPAM
jgi:hypothetical protein